MLHVIVGPNVLLAREKLRELRDAFIAEHGDFSLEQFDCVEASYDRVRESLQSMPFLAGRKLVILDTPSALKEFLDDYEQLLPNAPEETDVIVYEPTPDKRTSYYKFLKSQKAFYEYASLDERALVDWLVQSAKQAGGSITRQNASYLVDRVGGDQYGLKNELDKLLSFEKTISRDTINLLTDPSPKSTIFELLEAALSGRTERTLEIYAEQRQLKVEPQQILAMLAWQLHVLALLATAPGKSDGDIAKAAKLSPYVVGKSRHLLKRVGASRLKNLITELADLDYKAKTSAIDMDRGLRTYIVSIS